MFDSGQIKSVNDLKSSLIINNKTYSAVVRAEPYCTQRRPSLHFNFYVDGHFN